jgi:phage tail sheath protein FI
MPQALLHPGVYIEEVPSGVRTISGVGTSTALFIGWAPRGPVDKAGRVFSFADFERTYGGLDGRSLLGYSVRHFYDNGGSDAYILRIANGATPAQVVIGALTINASSPGTWANAYNVVLTRRPDDATRFKIDVIDPANGNAVVESFANLSMTSTDPRFAPAVINGQSAYMDKLAAASAVTPGSTAVAGVGLGSGTPGADGTVQGPADAAFRTSLLAFFNTGNAADQIDLFNILCVPGLNDTVTLGLLQGHARNRRAFLIIDCAPNATAATTGAAGVGTPANLPTGVNAVNSALYFPWVLAPDPLKSGTLTAYPPSGFVAGILARTDASRGVWKAPAGTEASLTGVAGLTVTLSDTQNGLLNPLGINCLRTFPVYGNVVWGARTVAGNDQLGSEWKYVPVRRMALFLEESLYRGTQWVVFEPNDEPLWAQIRLNIGAFLQGLFRQGAFQGKSPKEAYFVKCDRETTTQADINLGIVNILVGFAPLKPAEFVVLKIQQMAGDIPT